MNAFVRSSQNETMIRCSLIHTTEDWYRKRNQPRMKLRQEKGEGAGCALEREYC